MCLPTSSHRIAYTQSYSPREALSSESSRFIPALYRKQAYGANTMLLICFLQTRTHSPLKRNIKVTVSIFCLVPRSVSLVLKHKRTQAALQRDAKHGDSQKLHVKLWVNSIISDCFHPQCQCRRDRIKSICVMLATLGNVLEK